MSAVRVKICGIRSLEEAFWAIEAGASALGFVFADSPRQVTPEEAAAICRRLPPFITRVGVFVNEAPDHIRRVARFCGLDAVQLHGDEPPEHCRLGPGLKVIKALRVDRQDPASLLAEVCRYEVAAILLDSKIEGRYGGSGVTFDWRTAAALRRSWPGPLILAGGLDRENVLAAIRLVRPYAVDASSGVERNGQKDRGLLKEFISLIHYSNYEYATGKRNDLLTGERTG